MWYFGWHKKSLLIGARSLASGRSSSILWIKAEQGDGRPCLGQRGVVQRQAHTEVHLLRAVSTPSLVGSGEEKAWETHMYMMSVT